MPVDIFHSSVDLGPVCDCEIVPGAVMSSEIFDYLVFQMRSLVVDPE